MKTRNKKFLVSTLFAVMTFCLVGGITFIGAWSQPKERVARAETVETFKIEETAAVRKSNPNGIRFTTTVDSVTKAKAEALKNPVYGTIMLPKDLLGDRELTLNTSKVLNVRTTTWQDVAQTEYTGVLVGKSNGDGTYENISDSYYNRSIIARGYVTGTDKHGNTVTYYTSNVAERSMGYVAVMAQLENDTSSLVADIASKTNIELIMSETQLSTKNEVDGDALIYNAANENEDAVASLKIGGVCLSPEKANELEEKGLFSISYQVGDASVAAVNGNVIKGLQAGDTTVAATVRFNGVQYTVNGELSITETFKAKSDYSILIAANATATEKAAANKLQSVIKEAASVTLPIVKEKGVETTAERYVSVGETALAKARFGDFSVTKETASEIKHVENTVFVRGVGDEGTLYGVQQLLGELVGYEFYTKDTYSLNSEPREIALPAVKSYTPAIEYNTVDEIDDLREDYGMQNLGADVISAPVGGSAWHNSTKFISDELAYDNDYMADAYFIGSEQYSQVYATKTSLGYTTNLTNDSGQPLELCYTAHGNGSALEAMQEAVADGLVEALLNDTSKYRVGFSISDTMQWCTCSNCTSAGNASDNVIKFLNDVAVKVKTGLAGDSRQNTFRIVTLAYHATNVAPANVKTINEHIEIWFGDSYGDYTDGLKNSSSAKNQEIYTNLMGWVELIGGKDSDMDLRLWLYYTNTKNGFVPYNTFTAIRENYALAKEIGADYILNQTIQGRSGWSMLKHYLISKLVWKADPNDTEWQEWIDAYFANAYGGGADKMKEWFDDWFNDSTSAYATSNNDPAIHKDMANATNFPEATLRNWIGYADAALAALDANDPNYNVYYSNIMLEKLSPEYLLRMIYSESTISDAELAANCQAWSIDRITETGTAATDTTFKNLVNGMKVVTVNDAFIIKGVSATDGTGSGTVTLTSDKFIAGRTFDVTAGTWSDTVTVAEEGKLTVTVNNLSSGQKLEIICKDTQTTTVNESDVYYTVTFPNVFIVNEGYVVTVPAASNYYTYSSDNMIVEKGGSYTFTVAATKSGFEDIIVLVNGEVYGGVGTYTVENVTEDLTIKAVHGYIEYGSPATVEYSGSDAVTITHAAYAHATNGTHWAKLSSDYLAYMAQQGYTTLQFIYTCDGEIAANAWYKLNGADKSAGASSLVTLNLADITQDVFFWGMNSGGSGNAIRDEDFWLKLSNITYNVGVTVEDTDYFTVDGADSVAVGADYTFTVESNGKVANVGTYLVLVNGEEVKAVNGTYTVENVTETLTIKIAHGFIEADESVNASVSYAEDGTITITNSIWPADGTTRLHGHAYISAEYLEYMASQGYTTLQFYLQADTTTVAQQALAKYNGNHIAYITDGSKKLITVNLVAGSNSELEFWAQDSAGSGGNIKNQGGVLIITDLAFMVGVTAPTSSYYTFNGAASAALGKDYSFSLTPTIEGLDDFVVFVDGEEIEKVDGVYTVQNVVKDLTIEVLHGYIECGSPATAEYSGSDAVTLTHAAFAHTNSGYYAYISYDYIAYMYSKGYKSLNFTYSCDGEIAANAWYNYNGATKSAGTSSSITLNLADITQDVFFWGMNAGNSGNAIKDADFWLKITNLMFLKESITVAEEFIADAGVVTLENENFAMGDTYTVEGTAYTVEEDGQLTVTLSDYTAGAVQTVICKNADKGVVISFTNVFAVTKVIKTVDDLAVVGYKQNGASITGYYILGGDINGNGTKIAAGPYTWNEGFKGTFDGRGHTISNIIAGQGGMFNALYGATVKNVNFEDVSMNTDQYAALLASIANGNTTISDVNVSYVNTSVNTTATYDTGLLISRQSQKTKWTNITINASGLDVWCVFGSECLVSESAASKCTYTNVTVIANSVTKLCDTAAGGNKTESTVVKTLPGVEIILPINQTLSVRQDVDLDIGYADGALVMSNGVAELDISEVSEVTGLKSVSYNGAAISGATLSNAKLRVPVSAFGTAYGESNITAEFTLSTGNTARVTIPVLLITNVLMTAEEVQNFGYIAMKIGSNKTLQSGYFTLGNNIDFSTYNGGVYIPYLQRNAFSPSWGSPTAVGFNGVFDGRGYTISNMTVGDGATNSNASGFIPVLHVDGVIRNVGFANVSANLAGLFGIVTSVSGGLMENIYVSLNWTKSNGIGVLFRTDNVAGRDNVTPIVRDVFVDISKGTYGDSNSPVGWTGQVYALGGATSSEAFGKFEGAYSLLNLEVNNQSKIAGNGGAVAGSVYAGYDKVASFASDAEAQAEMTTWNTEYWTITNGVPVWNTAQ